MAKKEFGPCPLCGGRVSRKTERSAVEYKGESVVVEETLWRCQRCGEGFLEGGDGTAANEAFKELRAKVNGVLTPARVQAIRKQLGLTQVQAGKLLGGGPRAFQKYESGETPPSVPMSNLLRLLANDPKRLRELAPAGTTTKSKTLRARAAKRPAAAARVARAPRSATQSTKR